ncbi:radical SAM family heme chaperone HemW [Minwuia sp.]|uniref:radical SAM family heme chaperone HemW n=1 Tax=Minwuia sp. TaxID=2493630 RepID=UPI003A8D4089
MDFGIYVHWPFCVSKCPYCDFNSHVRETVDQDRWRSALLAETGYWRERIGQQPVRSIFFGGGTPSLMPPATVAALIAEIDAQFGLADDVEITLEANPSTVEAGRFQDFRAAGINRLSLGVQSFDDEALRFLGRAHDADTALAAIATARQTFERFSFDLIYALPDQTGAAWRQQLERAIDLSRGHLSLYQLTIEPNTGFAGAVRRRAFQPMDDDRAADLFDLTQRVCDAAGIPAYETSNHAVPGQESRHNLIYWQYGSWIGIGPGAHGRPVMPDGRRHATANVKKPERWLTQVETNRQGLDEDRSVPAAEQAEEALMMGLRLSRGIDQARFRHRTGTALSDLLDPTAVEGLARAELIVSDGDGIQVRPEGRLLLNSITGQLLDGARGR